MEAWLSGLFGSFHIALLFAVIAASLYVLVRGADLLVDMAVSLSVSWGVPKMLIGATIVSLGTTLPETAVSVFAAIQGSPGLALGNAVGSIIADTGLILGLAVLIGPIPVDRSIVSRQGWIQFGSAMLLVIVSVPYFNLGGMFTTGGRVYQWVGFAFLGLLGLYIWRSIAWSRSTPDEAALATEISSATADIIEDVRPILSLLKLAVGITLVVLSSQVLIPAVEETAYRLRIPEAIIAATLVAFGTSLPELVTAITAVRKKHGELALGNVIGADVLNVLFVSGASAAATGGGLEVPPQFFVLYFPAMIFVVTVLRIGLSRRTTELRRGFGFVLLGAYIITVIAGYVIPGVGGGPH